MKYAYEKAASPTEFSAFVGELERPKDFASLAKDVPCQAACPAKTDVPAYIEHIALGNNDAAYRINQEDNVFPGVLGRVCSRPCEDACRHQWTGVEGPVSICHLKREGADHRETKPEPLPAWYGASGKRVAVVGGGPAGLTAARELRRYGHAVTIIEREEHLGGMLVNGIPRFRLPREVVDEEVDLIVRSGVEVRTGISVDAAGIQQLRQDHDAVLIATGTPLARTLDLGSLPESQSVTGLDFMRGYNRGDIERLQGDIVVIGGGFTAVDCARACARAALRLLGGEGSVAIMYRRGEKQMSADAAERLEVQVENVEIRTLVAPIGAELDDDGRLRALRFRRNKIVDGEQDGKTRVAPVEGGEFSLPCDLVITAIGQQQDWSVLPDGCELIGNGRTTVEDLFVAGDLVSGSLDVIHAVADGKRAAEAIDEYLTGAVRTKTHVSVELIGTDGETGRVREHDLQRPASVRRLPIIERAAGEAEVELGFDHPDRLSHATRCYLCNHKFEIDAEKCILCNWCIEVSPRDCIKRVSRLFEDEHGSVVSYVEASKAEDTTFVFIDSKNCIRCGKCLRVCPTQAISMRRMRLVTERG